IFPEHGPPARIGDGPAIPRTFRHGFWGGASGYLDCCGCRCRPAVNLVLARTGYYKPGTAGNPVKSAFRKPSHELLELDTLNSDSYSPRHAAGRSSERVEALGSSAAERLVPKGALPGTPLERDYYRPIRAADKRKRQHTRLQQRTIRCGNAQPNSF